MTEIKKGTGITGRRLALLSLVRIEKDGAFANRVLNSLFRKYRPKEQERGLATEVVYGTLRHLTLIDYLLDHMLSKPLPILPIIIRNILRLSLYQLISTPQIAYAVVDEGVNLTKLEAGNKLSGLVNAVLRRYIREGNDIPRPRFEDNPLLHLTLVHSHPEWLVKKWVERWGVERVHRLVKVNNLPAPFTIRTNTLKLERRRLIELLSAAELEVVPSTIVREALRIADPRRLTETTFFEAGYYFIQDEASMLVGHLADPRAGETVVDLCAAPGGKTTHLAQLMGDEGRIFALDNHPHKVNLIEENAKRMNIRTITAVTADAREWSLKDSKPDVVLLDAPCTGTGVLRRRPDIRWRRTLDTLRELSTLQKQLLENAGAMLRPGGRLIYSTCSLESEENEEQIREFTLRHPEFSIEIPPGFAPGMDKEELSEGLLIFPQESGADGFFMTRLVKSTKVPF